MKKIEFLDAVGAKLRGLPREDIARSLDFYSEMIDDRIEDGLTEEAAVLAMGSVDGVVSEIMADTPLSSLVREKIKSRRRVSPWEMVLIVLGAPVWLSLLIAVFIILLSVYIVIWSVVVSLFAVVVSLAASSVGLGLAGVVLAAMGHFAQAFLVIGVGFICAGTSILMAFVSVKAAELSVYIGKLIIIGVKRIVLGKGGRGDE